MKKLVSAFSFLMVCTLSVGIFITSACTSKDKPDVASPEVENQDSVTKINEDSLSLENKQQIADCKAFLEEFYKGLEKDFLDYDFIRKHITSNAEQILKDGYDYDCEDGDCLATWMFAYEAGGDTGPLSERIIEAVDANTYLVTSIYAENYKYSVELGLVKEGNNYKIDTLEPVEDHDSSENNE